MEDKRREYLMAVIKNIIKVKLFNIEWNETFISAMNAWAASRGFEGNFTLEELNKYLSLL